MAQGYSSVFIKNVREADRTKIGVQLGRVCIDNDIPVVEVAEFFTVSRMTVYSWFRGKTNVPEKHRGKMQELVKKLR
jgi:hypothetical protein